MRIERIELQGQTFSQPIGIVRLVDLRDDPHRDQMERNGQPTYGKSYYAVQCHVCGTDFSAPGEWHEITHGLSQLSDHLGEHDSGHGGEDDLTDEERDAILEMCTCHTKGKTWCQVGWHH